MATDIGAGGRRSTTTTSRAARAGRGGRLPDIPHGLASTLGKPAGKTQPCTAAVALALDLASHHAVQRHDIAHRGHKAGGRTPYIHVNAVGINGQAIIQAKTI